MQNLVESDVESNCTISGLSRSLPPGYRLFRIMRKSLNPIYNAVYMEVGVSLHLRLQLALELRTLSRHLLDVALTAEAKISLGRTKTLRWTATTR